MKTFKLYYLLLAATITSLALSLTACGTDDEDEVIIYYQNVLSSDSSSSDSSSSSDDVSSSSDTSSESSVSTSEKSLSDLTIKDLYGIWISEKNDIYYFIKICEDGRFYESECFYEKIYQVEYEIIHVYMFVWTEFKFSASKWNLCGDEYGKEAYVYNGETWILDEDTGWITDYLVRVESFDYDNLTFVGKAHYSTSITWTRVADADAGSEYERYFDDSYFSGVVER